MEETPNAGIVQATYQSFYSRPFYQSVAAHWRWRGLGYLFVILAVLWIPGIINPIRELNKAFVKIEGQIPKIPEITIDKGEVHTPEQKPYAISFSEDPKAVDLLIDATGKTTSLDQTTAHVLVLKNQVIVRKSKEEVRTYDLAKIDHLLLDHDLLKSWVRKISRWITTLLFPFMLLMSWVKNVAVALLLSILGILVAKWMGADLSWPALFNTACAALTPTFVVRTVLSLIPSLKFNYGGILSLILSVGFYLFAVNAASDTDIDVETPTDA